MKKLTIAAAVLGLTIICSYCKNEHVQQARIANIMVDGAVPAMKDFIIEPRSGNKLNLGQADIN
jgi:hypothetical protein